MDHMVNYNRNILYEHLLNALKAAILVLTLYCF